MRAFEVAASMPWLIEASWLETILAIAARENETVEAVEARLGRKLDNTYAVRVRDRVAIIPVNGVIFRRASWFSMISGGASTELLARDFTSALEDSSIRAIVFDIDSPGGEAFGIPEFADMIFAARGQKPIGAYIGGAGCSAAYWIASACDQVLCDQGAITGSIGVVMAMRAGKNEKEVEFVSSQSPKKRPDVETEAGREQVQTIVDDLAAVFLTTVARNRDTTVETVMSDFGQGASFVGQKAVDAGLVDRLGSLEGLIAELSAGEWKHSRTKKRAAKPAKAAAASGTEGVMAEENRPGIWDRLRAQLGLTSDQTEKLRAIVEDDAPATTSPAPPSGPTAREQELQATLEREREARGQLEARVRNEQATAFAKGLVRAGKAIPAQNPALTTLYLQLAEDDAARPMSTGSRLEALQQLFADALPHGLTAETEIPTGAKVLDPVATPADPVDADRKAAAEFFNRKSN